jgi:aspartyl protease
MNAAHLNDEINQFDSSLCGSYHQPCSTLRRSCGIVQAVFDHPLRIDSFRQRGYFRVVAMIHHVAQSGSSLPPSSGARPWQTKGCGAPAPAQRSGRVRRALILLALLLVPAPNRAHSGVVRVPFRTVQSMILVQGSVNGRPVTFLLDTGADRTIVSVRTYGDLQFQLHPIQHNHNGPGMIGESLRLPVDLTLANRLWVGQRVSVMNLEDLQKILGITFDGLLGEDILREFRSVRIDYHAHVIELEE